jgi:hypothetical protein
MVTWISPSLKWVTLADPTDTPRYLAISSANSGLELPEKILSLLRDDI